MCVFFFPLSNSLPELMASLLSVVIRVPAPVHTNISRLFFVCFFLQSETNKQKMSFRLHVYVRTEHNTFQKKNWCTNQSRHKNFFFSPIFFFLNKKTQQNSKGKGKLNLNKTVVGCDGGGKKQRVNRLRLRIFCHWENCWSEQRSRSQPAGEIGRF